MSAASSAAAAAAAHAQRGAGHDDESGRAHAQPSPLAMASTADTPAAAATATAAALLRGVSGETAAVDDMARALEDIQARCHVEDGSAPEGARFARCLAHALALMAAGAPGALGELLVVSAHDAFRRTQVLLSLRALFAPAARLRGRTPAVCAQAAAALGAFAAPGGVAAAATLLSHGCCFGRFSGSPCTRPLCRSSRWRAPLLGSTWSPPWCRW
jgi:hypothetical protein